MVLSLGARERIQILYVREKSAVIMLKILGETVQNFVARTIRRPWFVHPCTSQ